MKNIIISSVFAFVLMTGANAQNPLTNTVEKCKIPKRSLEDIITAANAVSSAYDVRIRTEDGLVFFYLDKQKQQDEKLPNVGAQMDAMYKSFNDRINDLPDDVQTPAFIKEHFREELTELENVSAEFNSLLESVSVQELTFANATLEHVLDTVVKTMPEHTWRYEAITDTVYIHPITNSLLIARCDPIFATNAPLRSIMDADKTLKPYLFDTSLIWHGRLNLSWMDEKVTLEYEDAFVWEVLDAIETQLSDKWYWRIHKRNPANESGTIMFYKTSPKPSP